MDAKEKLVELLKECEREYENFVNKTSFIPNKAEFVAGHLLANGVTLQDVPDNDVGKWISVKDRLPEEFTNVLVCDVHDDYVGKWEYKRNGIWDNEGFSFYSSDITHWMPLPQPPKGEWS